ncbi:MAG: GTPase HflX [Caldisphaeraceae archaeon]|nr:GTPase HflX [Caldisphaeraceae archaeon]MEB3797765.1 GTPase HflX [Caldisphaeraceae archaeon]
MESEEKERALLLLSKNFLNHYNEAVALAETAGYEIVEVKKLRREKKIGKGKINEIKKAVEEGKITSIIYYGDIQPSSLFKLEKETRTKIIDRVMLILDIFALHAGSKEAMLQIEMAKIKHELPFMREYIRRSKMGELVGFLGPGNYGIDAYRKQQTSRLSRIKEALEEIRRREHERAMRRKMLGMTIASIVGYASAGKTSLFNAITNENKKVGKEYFTTLYPKHKMVVYRDKKVLFVDTVGFIREVPPEVVEAFYSTLEEVSLSDVIVFVVDMSEDAEVINEKIIAGGEILRKLNASSRPIIFALNKVDMVDNNTIEKKLDAIKKISLKIKPDAEMVMVSATNKIGIEKVLEKVMSLAGREVGKREIRSISNAL